MVFTEKSILDWLKNFINLKKKVLAYWIKLYIPNSFAKYRKMATDWHRTIGSELAPSFISNTGNWPNGLLPANKENANLSWHSDRCNKLNVKHLKLKQKRSSKLKEELQNIEGATWKKTLSDSWQMLIGNCFLLNLEQKEDRDIWHEIKSCLAGPNGAFCPQTPSIQR